MQPCVWTCAQTYVSTTGSGSNHAEAAPGADPKTSNSIDIMGSKFDHKFSQFFVPQELGSAILLAVSTEAAGMCLVVLRTPTRCVGAHSWGHFFCRTKCWQKLADRNEGLLSSKRALVSGYQYSGVGACAMVPSEYPGASPSPPKRTQATYERYINRTTRGRNPHSLACMHAPKLPVRRLRCPLVLRAGPRSGGFWAQCLAGGLRMPAGLAQAKQAERWHGHSVSSAALHCKTWG